MHALNKALLRATTKCALNKRYALISNVHLIMRQYGIVMPRAYGSLPVILSFIHSFCHSFCHFHEFLLTQASAAAANRFIDIQRSCGAFKIVRI